MLAFKQDTHSVLKLINKIENLSGEKVKTAVAGFDAAVDTIIRPIKKIESAGHVEFFSTIYEFGRYLSAQSGKSCAVDVRRISRRLGGNMPNLSSCLSALGVEVSCIGTMGLPEPLDIFRGTGGRLFTIGEAGECAALQFDDGKIMLSDMNAAEHIGYESIEHVLGKNRTYRLFSEADMLGFLNWAELPRATDIWHGIYKNILQLEAPDKSKLLLVDLTDCSKKPAEEIVEVKEVIDKFEKYRRVVWSLNEKEAVQLGEALGCCGDKPLELLESIMPLLRADLLFIHGQDYCAGTDGRKIAHVPGFFVEKPLISVGGGDNFNAGIAFALLHGFDIYDTGLFANAVASYFVRFGKSPTLHDINSFLKSETQ